MYLALPPLASDYHYQEQGVQQLILNKPVNKLISFRRSMGYKAGFIKVSACLSPLQGTSLSSRRPIEEGRRRKAEGFYGSIQMGIQPHLNASHLKVVGVP